MGQFPLTISNVSTANIQIRYADEHETRMVERSIMVGDSVMIMDAYPDMDISAVSEHDPSATYAVVTVPDLTDDVYFTSTSGGIGKAPALSVDTKKKMAEEDAAAAAPRRPRRARKPAPSIASRPDEGGDGQQGAGLASRPGGEGQDGGQGQGGVEMVWIPGHHKRYPVTEFDPHQLSVIREKQRRYLAEMHARQQQQEQHHQQVIEHSPPTLQVVDEFTDGPMTLVGTLRATVNSLMISAGLPEAKVRKYQNALLVIVVVLLMIGAHALYHRRTHGIVPATPRINHRHF